MKKYIIIMMLMMVLLINPKWRMGDEFVFDDGTHAIVVAIGEDENGRVIYVFKNLEADETFICLEDELKP